MSPSAMGWAARFLTVVSFLAAGVLFALDALLGCSGAGVAVARLAHILCFATAWGAALWVTFIGGIVMFKYLPRHQFGNLQGKMFPAYFMLMSVCSAISVAAFAYLHPWKTASTIERYQLGFLMAALGLDLSNLLVFTPMTIEVMFGAGTDTSFIVLEYAMVELMQKPHLMAKLQTEARRSGPKGKEIFTEEDLISSMPYLKAVIKETLRLHPPAPLLVPHLSMADCDVEGYTIPSGTRVIINGWALGRDPNSWEMADEFMPERFMEGGSSAAVDYKGNDFHFLPFGTGRRICPGINFASTTIEIMLANLMYNFNWELPKGSMIDTAESFGVTVHRKEKLLLVPTLLHD